MIGNHWQPMSLLNNASYCFYVDIQLSHNRLVAGSNPAGATKFFYKNHEVNFGFRLDFNSKDLLVPPFCPPKNLFEPFNITFTALFHRLSRQLPIQNQNELCDIGTKVHAGTKYVR
ncbi:hypothetical protein ACSST1_02085 [Pantoea agglomerans]|uniref:hypothetical protein n=1 Tax=Enterobacter agglomerans TaxID=549 RepID=UPI003EDAF1F9